MLKVTKLLLILFLGFIISSVSILFSGIKINSFSFGNISVSQFYIKLDKKLIVDIDNIEYKSRKSKVENSLDDLKKNLELLPKILKIFQRIHVERLKIDGNEFTISLTDESIYLDNKFINLSSLFDFNSNQVVFDLYSLYLKDIKVMFNGKVKVDYFNEKLNHIGNFFYEDISGDIKLDADTKKADFYVNSKKFKSLKFLKNFFRLSPAAEAWMYDKVSGDIQLQEFYGTLDLIDLKLLEKSIQARATVENAKVKFHENLATLDDKRIDIEFKKGNLNFDLNEPNYQGVSLKGSSVKIKELLSSTNGEVVIDIKTKTKVDKNLLDILNAYGISLPIVQKTGITSGQVLLKIPYLEEKKMSTKGQFFIENADISLQSFDFHAKKAKVELLDTLVKIKDADVTHKDMIDAKLNLNIDTKTLSASGDTIINSFFIQAGDKEIVHVKNEKSKLEVDFSKDVYIGLPTLDVKINIKDNLKVEVGKIEKVYPYSELLKALSIKGGKFKLDLKNAEDMSFEAYATGLQFPIYKNNSIASSLNVKGVIRKDYINVYTTNGDIEYKILKGEHFLNIQNYMVYINTKDKAKKEIPILNVKGKNIDLKINEDLYYLVNAEARIEPKLISFSAKAKDLNIPLIRNGKKVTTLEAYGSIDEKNGIVINDKVGSLRLTIKDKKLDISLTGYDVEYKTGQPEKKEDEDSIKKIDIKAISSNIIINDKFKFPADSYEIRLREKTKYFNLKHNKTEITYKELENGKINVYGNDIKDKFINTIFAKQMLKGGNIMLVASGVKDNLVGKILLTNVKVEDLAILNNLFLFIHTTPALLNPLLGIPSLINAAANDGFNFTGYDINNGLIEFKHNMDTKLFDITKLVTIGNGIDFDGTGRINLSTATINSNIKTIFFKDYSSIVGAIPVVNYVVLGKDKRVETKVNIFGPLSNPKISTNLTKEAFSVPVNIAKRVLTSPIEFVDFLKDLAKDTKGENSKSSENILEDNGLNGEK